MRSLAEYKTPEQKKAFYKSAAWQRVRRNVLYRDNYECQECKRQGRVYTDQSEPHKHKRLDVDHIKEIEFYSELSLQESNCEVLCIKCHNRKHDRFQYVRKKNKWDDERW